MRKSRSITLTLMAGLAAACTQEPQRNAVSVLDGLSPANTIRRCVDDQSRVVGDSLCSNALIRSGSGGASGGAGGHGYFFYYGGSVRSVSDAAVVSGGTRTSLNAPHQYARRLLAVDSVR